MFTVTWLSIGKLPKFSSLRIPPLLRNQNIPLFSARFPVEVDIAVLTSTGKSLADTGTLWQALDRINGRARFVLRGDA